MYDREIPFTSVNFGLKRKRQTTLYSRGLIRHKKCLMPMLTTIEPIDQLVTRAQLVQLPLHHIFSILAAGFLVHVRNWAGLSCVCLEMGYDGEVRTLGCAISIFLTTFLLTWLNTWMLKFGTATSVSQW